MNPELIAYIQSLSATHFWTFDNEGVDRGDSPTPSTFTIDNGSFEPDPVCGGVDYCFTSTTTTNGSRLDAGRVPNQQDINTGHDYGTSVRTVALWFRPEAVVDAPTCIYEQGAEKNNVAIILGIGKAITFQAADDGEPFLIAQSLFQAVIGRDYHVSGGWEHASQHAGGGCRTILIINGVWQETTELGGTGAFPASHAGDIVFGNTQDSLKSYNNGTMLYAARAKSINTPAFFNHVSLTVAQCRDWFERTVIPVHEITGTVAQQQAALDALSGQTFAGINCAIRIVQATDATDYRLFVDNITFIEDPNLRDIAIQFVGAGVLTIENVNGSNAVEISSPSEAYKDRSTTYTGGGSIVLVTSNTKRITSERALDNQTLDKLVITQVGEYTLTNCFIDEIENVSGGAVTVITDRPVNTVTDSVSGSATSLLDALLSFANDWELCATQQGAFTATEIIASGNSSEVYRFTFSGAETFYLRLYDQGLPFVKIAEVTQAGVTEVELSQLALLSAIKEQLDYVEGEVVATAETAEETVELVQNIDSNLDSIVEPVIETHDVMSQNLDAKISESIELAAIAAKQTSAL